MELLRVKYDLWVDEWDDLDGETQVTYFTSKVEFKQFVREVPSDIEGIYDEQHQVIVVECKEANIIDLVHDYEARIIDESLFIETLSILVFDKDTRKGRKVYELETMLQEKGIL